MPRQSRLDAPGVLHHVIIRGIERQKIFKDKVDQDNFLDRLSALLPETQTTCYAWALMGNHAHLLFRSGPAGLAGLMRRLLTGYAVNLQSAPQTSRPAVSKPLQIDYLPGRCLSERTGALHSPKPAQGQNRDRPQEAQRLSFDRIGYLKI